MDKTSDYEGFMELYGEEVLRSALAAIDPDKMGMSRDQALTLGGAMQACGCFTQEDFAEVLARSPQDKGTMAKQWGKLRGSGNKRDCTPGTIYKYAQACGWKWPAPSDYIGQNGATGSRKKSPKKPRPVGAVIMQEDATIACLMDEVRYTHKPTSDEASKEIRRREPVPTPPPATYTPAEFAMAVSSGQTFYPCIYCKEEDGLDEKGKKHYSYRPVAQQVFVVDIDNEEHYKDEAGKTHKRCIANPLTIEAALQICKDNGISPFFVYETFSSKLHRDDKEAPYTKFRLCFATEKPLTVQKVGEKGLQDTTQYFISLFGAAADTSTTDPARMIFGTDEPNRAKYSTAVLDNAELAKKVYAPRNEETEDASDEKELTPEEYAQTSAAGYIQDFRNGISDSVNTPAISTGFANLDTVLDGGLYPGLYILGAISSLGKTTLALQMADNLAQQGQDVLIFSLEMARSELMAKSISRHTFLLADRAADAKTVRGITTGARYDGYSQTEKDLIEEAIAAYKVYAQHIYIHEGVGDIGVEQVKEEVQKHVAMTGNKPVVIIDYVQILAPYDLRASDKQNCDKAVLELKRLSRDYKIPVLGISSFNRDSYKTGSGNKGKVSMPDFKESGAIEYGSDVLMGLEFSAAGTNDYDEKKEKEKNPRQIRLVVLKNRNGRAWASASFNYHPLFNYYEEEDQAGGWQHVNEAPDVFKDMRAR